jgi:DnaK suppressor protein
MGQSIGTTAHVTRFDPLSVVNVDDATWWSFGVGRILKEREVTSHQAIARALQSRLHDLTQRVDDLEADLRQPLDAGFAEQATDLQDDEALSALEDAGRAEIIRIKAALSRIKEGIYGTCVKCGKEIAPARLAALLTAAQCAACSGAAPSIRPQE